MRVRLYITLMKASVKKWERNKYERLVNKTVKISRDRALQGGSLPF